MQTKESIIALLKDNDVAVVKGLKTIRQKAGFNSGDHNFASSLLDQVAKWEGLDPKKRYPAPLSIRQFDAARSLLSRYAAVLARLANDKNKPVKAPVENDDERWHPLDDADDTAAERYVERQNEMAYMQDHPIDW